MNPRFVTVTMMDDRRMYAHTLTSSLEAIRLALQAGIDAWVDDELAAWIAAPEMTVPPIRIEVRG